MRVLVDTSVWSQALRRRVEDVQSTRVRGVLADLINDVRVEIIGPIRQELLSGIRSREGFDRLRHRLAAFADLPLTTGDFELAAEYANTCRRSGIQGSPTDFLICAVAVRNGLAIYTLDGDFRHYQSILPLTLFGDARGQQGSAD